MSVLWLAKVNIVLKPVVNDPEGLAIQGGLKSLGFEQVTDVRSGKLIEIRLESPDRKTAREQVISMCRKLLANPVIEDYRFTLAEARS
ncbi:MAG TPA: phosphoribosylformylglycinamidine synthase subunit PurS [Chloroflexota bacterium]|nr:phosphoribosylformylglycinamidine synthase subunit PurS [Chloroflexota bacterium]